MKPSLRGIGNYDFKELLLKDSTQTKHFNRRNLIMGTGRQKDTNNDAITRNHVHELLALKYKANKSTKSPSRACSRCDKEFDYCVKLLPNGNIFPNPICSILGPMLCGGCSIRVKQQEEMNDTTRILGKFEETGIERNMKEQALFSRVNSECNDVQLPGYERRGNDKDRDDYVLTPGCIARYNTPDTRYINNNQRNRNAKVDKFCQQPMKSALKNVSLMKESNKVQDTNIYSLPELDHSNSTSRYFQVGSLWHNKFDQDFDMYWPTVPGLDTEALKQKISDIFEQRYLPPVNRSVSTTSTESNDIDIDLCPMEPTEDEHITYLKKSCHKERDRDEGTNEEASIVCPPLMDVKVQLSRRNMFSNMQDWLPNVVQI